MKYSSLSKIKEALEKVPSKPKRDKILTRNETLEELSEQLWKLSEKGYSDEEIAKLVTENGVGMTERNVRYRIKKYKSNRKKKNSKSKRSTAQIKLLAATNQHNKELPQETTPAVTKTFDPLVDSEEL